MPASLPNTLDSFPTSFDGNSFFNTGANLFNDDDFFSNEDKLFNDDNLLEDQEKLFNDAKLYNEDQSFIDEANWFKNSNNLLPLTKRDAEKKKDEYESIVVDAAKDSVELAKESADVLRAGAGAFVDLAGKGLSAVGDFIVGDDDD